MNLEGEDTIRGGLGLSVEDVESNHESYCSAYGTAWVKVHAFLHKNESGKEDLVGVGIISTSGETLGDFLVL